uniref:hypothetical protein n=1 Tax=Lacticaseibacillus paracasei TaxID=1597 RepID=UPI00403F6706
MTNKSSDHTSTSTSESTSTSVSDHTSTSTSESGKSARHQSHDTGGDVPRCRDIHDEQKPVSQLGINHMILAATYPVAAIFMTNKGDKVVL